MRAVRGRFAPSPTGELHLGNVRTALAAWLAARAARGTVVMRVEDLDPPRVIPGAESRILEALAWLGLDWDEGPDVGGAYGPYRQSEREGAYREALELLARGGHLYACDCSRAQLRGLASAPHGPGSEGPRYPGTCRDKRLPLDLDVVPKPGGRVTAIRFRSPEGTVAFDDALHGRFEQDVATEVGDFVVRRADGLHTYQLAVVVDDAAMEIDQVVRGDDLLHSTPRQIALQRALGFDEPAYAHVPLVVDASGERLAKRDRAVAIDELRRSGLPSEQIVGELAISLGLLEGPALARPSDLVEAFSWSRVPREPWRVGDTLFKAP
jgi:glutamyl-tRNA synthetase